MLIAQQTAREKPIPTNIITGFLGVGKTTAIRHLLATKPADERWSVLVNEFGEIGIDGALLQDTNAQIREVPGGCICCVADLPMRMALNMLVHKTNPDRILIEPTGLGHPGDIINSLAGEEYQEVLDLRATVTLIDARKLSDSRYLTHAVFQDQIAVADILLANKNELSDEQHRDLFLQLLNSSEPPKQRWAFVEQGKFDISWLDLPRQAANLKYPNLHQSYKTIAAKKASYNQKIQLADDQEFIRRENLGQGFYSCGWLFNIKSQFNFNDLFGWMSGLQVLRAKAVMNTDRGVFMFNAEDGVLSVNEIMLDLAEVTDSRIELIHHEEMPVANFEAELLLLRVI
jgi:G3E family GTPase